MTKPISRAMAVNCLLHRASREGYSFICTECGEPCLPGQSIQFDHVHADAFNGPHEYQNLRPIHYDPCHKRKSKRDVGALAKIDRITGKTKGRTKRPWPEGRKLQGRGFQKRKP